jgi:hypothetical protein
MFDGDAWRVVHLSLMPRSGDFFDSTFVFGALSDKLSDSRHCS